jgi:uncharacterized protein (DUF1800 family)
MSKSSVWSSSLRLTCTLLFFGVSYAHAGSTPAISVTVQPSSLTVHLGDHPTFTARVAGTSNQAVSWTINGIPNGNAAIGTITSAGVYTPPVTLGAQSLTVVASSAVDHSKTATASITLQNAVPTLSSLTTSTGENKIVTGKTFALAVSGTNFLSSTSASLDDGTSLTVSFVSSSALTVTGTSFSAGGKLIHLTVSNPNDGNRSSGALSVTVRPQITVATSPKQITIRALANQVFSASVANSVNTAVTWSVNGTPGGNASVGTISPQGLYTAPALLPAAAVTISARSNADPTKVDQSTVTLLNAVPVITSVTSPLTAAQVVSIMVNGSGFAKNAAVSVGGTTATATWISSNQLRASLTIQTPVGGYTTIVVTNPDPGYAVSNVVPVQVQNAGTQLSYARAKQFLEQATWGPTPDSIAHLQAIGIDAWLTEQFDKTVSPESTYTPSPNENSSIDSLQTQFFMNALHGKDQLRQRIAFAISQILVVSAAKIHGYYQMMPYQQILLDDAFGTYHKVLTDVTMSPAMGRYLDMVDNDVPTPSTSPNENYARELLQLFTVGLAQLNPDGTETSSPPSPVYTEDDVRALARVLTGWTFPTCGSGAPLWPNPSCYQGQMVAVDTHHDQGPKSLLDVNIESGSATGDLELALNTIESHHATNSAIPSIAPFISLRLIQHLVTSNPNPTYVARIAEKYAACGGDLKQVVTAILKDPAAATSSGHLREPIFYEMSLLRALNATVTSPYMIPVFAANMGQNAFDQPSVFNFYSPLFRLPSGQLAPEFGTYNQQSALERANYAYAVTHNSWPGGNVKIDLTNLTTLASDTNPATRTASLTALLNASSQALLGIPLRSDMAAAILPALLATSNPVTRAETALYLLAISPQYQIEQ